MLIELKYVEVEIEIEEVFEKALSDMDLSIRDAINICESVSSAEEILDYIDNKDIQNYCEKQEIELECSFEMIVKNLKTLSKEQRASLFWFIIGINDEEIKKLVTVELIVPKMNELINIKQKNKVINPIWDSRDDYSFATEEDIEINIRAYNEGNYHLWIYNNKLDDECVDSMYVSISDLQEKINEVLGAKVTLPKIEDLLKVTRGEKNV